VFDAFKKADGAEGGLGLGLFIVREIVSRARGQRRRHVVRGRHDLLASTAAFFRRRDNRVRAARRRRSDG
jgi:hypothetical protein